MKVLAVGDIIGTAGIRKLKKYIIKNKRKRKYRFCNSKWRKFSRRNGNNRKKFQ